VVETRRKYKVCVTCLIHLREFVVFDIVSNCSMHGHGSFKKEVFFFRRTRLRIKLHCSLYQPTQVRALRKGQTNLISLGFFFPSRVSVLVNVSWTLKAACSGNVLTWIHVKPEALLLHAL
jgi:hypothetical protein